MLPHVLPNKLKTVTDYFNYLENIAFKRFGHTGAAPGEEKRFYTRVDELTGAGLKYPLMLAVLYPVTYPGQRDALFEAFEFDIWVVRQYGSDPKLIPSILDECKADCDDIVSKLEFDSYPAIATKPFTFFSLPDINGEALDDLPFPDKVAGWSIKPKIGNIKNFTYDASKW